MVNDITDKAPERIFETQRSMKEVDNLVGRQVLGVLCIGWQAVVGAAEGELGEADGGIRIGRNGGTEVLDIEGGVGNGDGEASCSLDLPCEC